jgi:hypothetical protein
MSVEAAATQPIHSPLRSHTREFFSECGRRGGGRPKLSEEERRTRAIARLERKLAALKDSTPCRAIHHAAADSESPAHRQRRKNGLVPKRCASIQTDRKAAR